MNRTLLIALLVIALVVIVLLVTVNVTQCDTFEGPFGFLRFTACEEAPIVDPG